MPILADRQRIMVGYLRGESDNQIWFLQLALSLQMHRRQMRTFHSLRFNSYLEIMPRRLVMVQLLPPPVLTGQVTIQPLELSMEIVPRSTSALQPPPITM